MGYPLIYFFSSPYCAPCKTVDKMLEEVRKYNPKETFPTFVLNGSKKVVVGYNEERLKDTLNIISQP